MRIIAVLTLLFMVGCTELPQAQNAIINAGAVFNDNIVTTSENAICRIISIAAWQRRYGRSLELTEAWNTICLLQPMTVSPSP